MGKTYDANPKECFGKNEINKYFVGDMLCEREEKRNGIGKHRKDDADAKGVEPTECVAQKYGRK